MPLAVRFRALGVRNPSRFNISALTTEVDLYLDKFMQDLLDSVKDYPPEPTNSRYQRRGINGGILGSWHIAPTTSASGVSRTITNTAVDKYGHRYAALVQGSLQTMMHMSTGWKRIDLAAEALRRRYRSDLQAIYAKHILRGP